VSTPPATLKRAKKRIRFSDPRLETELEPHLPGSHHSYVEQLSLQYRLQPVIVLRLQLYNHGDYGIPTSGTIQFEPLRQMLDGRLKRRLRRHRLSEEETILSGKIDGK
jgi:hypothetical protein